MAAAVSRALCVAAALACASATAAHGAVPPSTSWARVSGPTSPGNQLGLYRDKVGTLEVAWAQGNPATITVTRLDPSGNATGSSIVTSTFDGLGGLALLGMPDGSVRLFATGGLQLGLPSNQVGVNSYTSPAGGTSWSFDSSGPFGGAVADAAGELGATLAGNGWIVTTWSGAIVHVGVSPTDGDVSYQSGLGCCGAAPQAVTDSSTGAVVIAWISNSFSIEGVVVRQVIPNEAAQFALPSGTTEGSFGLAGRLGAPGAYVAYVDPAKQKVQLYEYQGGLQTVANGAFRVAKVFASPAGRLWVAWGSSDDGVYVTRSNKSVTKFEPVQHLSLPSGAIGFANAQGEASLGPLDLFADVLVGTNDRGFWRTHVQPQMTVTATTSVATTEITGHDEKKHSKKVGRVTFLVTDAGDPLNNALITVGAGGDALHVKTGSNGKATAPVVLDKNGQIPAGLALKATVTRAGYPAVKLTVRANG